MNLRCCLLSYTGLCLELLCSLVYVFHAFVFEAGLLSDAGPTRVVCATGLFVLFVRLTQGCICRGFSSHVSFTQLNKQLGC